MSFIRGAALVCLLGVAVRGAGLMELDAAHLLEPIASTPEGPNSTLSKLASSDRVLSQSEKQVQSAIADTAAALARLKGGHQAEAAVQEGQDINDQIDKVDEKIKGTAKKARQAEALAKAAAQPVEQSDSSRDQYAAEVAQKLEQVEIDRDQAASMLRQSEDNKAQSAKLLREAERKANRVDTMRISHAGEMVEVHDEARYHLIRALEVRQKLERKLEKNKGLLKLAKAKEQAAGDQVAIEASKLKEEKIEDAEKLKMTKAKDKAKMQKLKTQQKAEGAKIKSQANAMKRETTAEASAKASLQNLEAKQKQRENKEKMELKQAEAKLEATKEQLKVAKKEDTETLEAVKKNKKAADEAVKMSLSQKVAVKVGAPVNPDAVTAARQAAAALDALDASKMQQKVRHQEVLDVTKQLIQDKIAHRYMKLRHETQAQAAAEVKDRSKGKNKKKAKKILKKAAQRGRERERRIMQRARKEARKQEAKDVKKQKKLEAADVKKAKDAVKKAKSPPMNDKAKEDGADPKMSKEDQKANVAINQAFTNLIDPNAAASNGDKPC